MQVDYELNTITGNMEIAHRYDKEYFMSNLSMLLQWSPYSTEAELLKQVNSTFLYLFLYLPSFIAFYAAPS